jgi:hypothetical protein
MQGGFYDSPGRLEEQQRQRIQILLLLQVTCIPRRLSHGASYHLLFIGKIFLAFKNTIKGS